MASISRILTEGFLRATKQGMATRVPSMAFGTHALHFVETHTLPHHITHSLLSSQSVIDGSTIDRFLPTMYRQGSKAKEYVVQMSIINYLTTHLTQSTPTAKEIIHLQDIEQYQTLYQQAINQEAIIGLLDTEEIGSFKANMLSLMQKLYSCKKESDKYLQKKWPLDDLDTKNYYKELLTMKDLIESYKYQMLNHLGNLRVKADANRDAALAQIKQTQITLWISSLSKIIKDGMDSRVLTDAKQYITRYLQNINLANQSDSLFTILCVDYLNENVWSVINSPNTVNINNLLDTIKSLCGEELLKTIHGDITALKKAVSHNKIDVETLEKATNKLVVSVKPLAEELFDKVAIRNISKKPQKSQDIDKLLKLDFSHQDKLLLEKAQKIDFEEIRKLRNGNAPLDPVQVMKYIKKQLESFKSPSKKFKTYFTVVTCWQVLALELQMAILSSRMQYYPNLSELNPYTHVEFSEAENWIKLLEERSTNQELIDRQKKSPLDLDAPFIRPYGERPPQDFDDVISFLKDAELRQKLISQMSAQEMALNLFHGLLSTKIHENGPTFANILASIGASQDLASVESNLSILDFPINLDITNFCQKLATVSSKLDDNLNGPTNKRRKDSQDIEMKI